MTTSQVLTGVGLILALAVGSQVLASRLKIPALIILLPVGFAAVLLLTGEDDFNALGATVLQGSVEGPVYRLGARLPSHGVIAPYTGGEILFDQQLTRYEVSRRYASGGRICTRPADGVAPAYGSLLFLVRADGQLAPVTRTGPPEPQEGDNMILLGAAAGGS